MFYMIQQGVKSSDPKWMTINVESFPTLEKAITRRNFWAKDSCFKYRVIECREVQD